MKYLQKYLMFMCLMVTGMANAAFVGPYAVNNWTTILDGGSIDTSGAPDLITITSSNINSNTGSHSGVLLSSSQFFVHQAVTDSVISFSWNYHTEDSGGSSHDPFGWFLIDMNNPQSVSYNQLTEKTMYLDPQDTRSPIINNHQWGDHFFNVLAGQTFGFYAFSDDSGFGAAATRIYNFNVEPDAPAPVPIPAAIWLFGAPLLSLLSRKRKSVA